MNDRDGEDKPRIRKRDLWRLIGASYRESLPYLVLFIAAMLLVTWLLTEFVFR